MREAAISDQHPSETTTAADEAIAKLKAAMLETDRQIEALEYLSGSAEQVKSAFLRVGAEVESMQSLTIADPHEIADRFEQTIVPVLEAAVADASGTRSKDATLSSIQDLATKALEMDLAAFQKLVQAYRSQNQQLLSAGRELRESSSVLRRQWIEQTLALGRAVGLYDPPAQ